MRKLEVTELNRISAEEFKTVKKMPLVVVLDNVRSLHNVGSVFRTSDAFLIEKIILCGYNINLINRKSISKINSQQKDMRTVISCVSVKKGH